MQSPSTHARLQVENPSRAALSKAPPLAPQSPNKRGSPPSLQLQMGPYATPPRALEETSRTASVDHTAEVLTEEVQALQHALQAEEARGVQLLQRVGEATQQAAQAQEQADMLRAQLEEALTKANEHAGHHGCKDAVKIVR